MPVSMSCVAIWRCADAAGCTNVACRCGMMRRLMRETRQRGRLSLPTGRPWPLILAAAPRAKASVCGKTAAEAQEKTVCVSPSCCSTASKGISLWQSGSGSARKGSVCLSHFRGGFPFARLLRDAGLGSQLRADTCTLSRTAFGAFASTSKFQQGLACVFALYSWGAAVRHQRRHRLATAADVAFRHRDVKRSA